MNFNIYYNTGRSARIIVKVDNFYNLPLKNY